MTLCSFLYQLLNWFHSPLCNAVTYWEGFQRASEQNLQQDHRVLSGCPPPPLKEQKLKIIPQGILLPSWTLQLFTVRFPSVGLSWLGLLYVKSICSRLIKHWIDFLFSGVFLKGLYPWNPSSELVECFPFGNVILGTISPCSHPPLLRHCPHPNHLA